MHFIIAPAYRPIAPAYRPTTCEGLHSIGVVIAGSGDAAVQQAAEAVAQQLNVTKESVLPACLIAGVELSFHGRSLLQDDDDNWDEGIASESIYI